MIQLPSPLSQWSQLWAAALIKALREADLQNVKRGEAVEFLYVKDAVTGETGKLTVQSGVVTWTAL